MAAPTVHLHEAARASGVARTTGTRLGGIAGLAFACGVLVQDAVLLRGTPLPGAPLADVAAYYAANAAAVKVALAIVAVNVPCLLLYVATARRRLAGSEEGALWGSVAGSAVAVLVALFLAVTTLQVLLVADAATLAATPGLLALVWDLHSAAFGLVGIGLGALVGSLALGARHAALAPRWAAWVGVAGGALSLAGGAFATTALVAGVGLWLTFAGFACWIAFLVATSVRMVRGLA